MSESEMNETEMNETEMNETEMNETEMSETEMSETEMNAIKVNSADMNAKVTTIDDLPELPFQRILSHLDLVDLIRSRAVCYSWYERINCRKVKSLCCSHRDSRFMLKKSRWIRSMFVKNFITSPRIDRFLDQFAPTIFSHLKHFCLCNIYLYELRRDKNNIPVFAQTLSQFPQLERVEIINTLDIDRPEPSERPEIDFKLNLPMCISLNLENVRRLKKVTIEAPRLRQIKLVNLDKNALVSELDLVHGKSVERLAIGGLVWTRIEKNLEKLENLKYLHVLRSSGFDLRCLSRLEKLEELHLHEGNLASRLEELFQQKPSLRVYRLDTLLFGSTNQLATLYRLDDQGLLVYLAEQPARLVGGMPFCESLPYEAIERVAPEATIDLLNRFTDLSKIIVDSQIQDVQRFLDLLKSFKNIVRLEFSCDQPQDLFDRLPEYCAVQELSLQYSPSNLRFLLRLKQLIALDVLYLKHVEFFREISEELTNLSEFNFNYFNKNVYIEINHPKFSIFIDGKMTKQTTDLSVAIQHIT